MFERTELILTKEEINKIKNTNILIVGVGGVGGSAFESLVRLGIGKFTIIDNDTFDKSNLNRQILSNLENLGNNKAEEAKKRANIINKETTINSIPIFLDETNIDAIDYKQFDYIIDCCDTTSTKLLLIKKAIENNIKIISSMGTGNRKDPSKLIITDINKTNNDPLAKKMRKLLKDNNIKNKIPVVTSTEIPTKTGTTTIGSCYLVPNCAGILLASYILNDIIK